jgi:Holliday junction resolvasome RuvABC endonuclease subunit
VAKLQVLGLDPSLRNWGIALGTFDTTLFEINIYRLDSLHPVLPKGKQVRQNSLDLESAFQLYEGTLSVTKGVQAVFVEVPVGSQSARAMASYGICVGVLGALRASGVPFFEVTPTEVKLAGAGSKTATKEEMIDWAMKTHPNANWPMHQGKVSAAKAEHQADAVAAIHAGVASNSFRQMLSLIRAA